MRQVLEYLFNFIEHNIILVFLCVLILSIASAYSKKAKIIFLALLGGAAFYFALLCFYRLGIGIQGLYDWSCRCVVYLCNQIDYCNIISVNHMVFLPKFMEFALHHSISEAFFTFVETIVIFILVLIALEGTVKIFKNVSFKKININTKATNKIYYFSYNNNDVISKINFNLVLRC